MAAHPTVHPDTGLDCWRRGAGSPVGPKLGGSGAEARRGRSPKHAAALARRHNEGCKELGLWPSGTRRRADRDAVRRDCRRPRRSRGTQRDRGRSRAAYQFQATGADAGGCPQAKVNSAFRRETTVEPLSRAWSASPIRLPVKAHPKALTVQASAASCRPIRNSTLPPNPMMTPPLHTMEQAPMARFQAPVRAQAHEAPWPPLVHEDADKGHGQGGGHDRAGTHGDQTSAPAKFGLKRLHE